jgi:hypothetical protein
VPAAFPYVSALSTSPKRLSILKLSLITTNSSENRLPRRLQVRRGINNSSKKIQKVKPQIFVVQAAVRALDTPRVVINEKDLSQGEFRRQAIRCRHLPLESQDVLGTAHTLIFHPASCINFRTPVSTVRSVSPASTIQCPPAHCTWFTDLRHISGNLNIHLDLNTDLSHLNPCMISGFRSKLNENCLFFIVAPCMLI